MRKTHWEERRKAHRKDNPALNKGKTKTYIHSDKGDNETQVKVIRQSGQWETRQDMRRQTIDYQNKTGNRTPHSNPDRKVNKMWNKEM